MFVDKLEAERRKKERNLAKSKLEFIVEGSPGAVLEMVRGFFESDEWPYTVKRSRRCLHEAGRSPRAAVVAGHNKVVASISKPRMLESLLGFFWFVKQARVTVVRDERGWTKLVVSATKPEYAQTLAAWIQRELIENKAATRAEAS
jgi:hypothetical protein